jgi:preprotein translocase subunit SecF
MKEFEFINKRKTFFLVSFVGIIVTIFLMFFKGLNLGLDFTGGTLVQVVINKNVPIEEIRKILSNSEVKGFDVQRIISLETDKVEYIIRIKSGEQNRDEMAQKIRSIFDSQQLPYEIRRIEYVGPTIGRYLTKQTLYAITFSLIGIIIYVGIRFKSSIWGVAGVVALFHDVFLTLGFLILLGREITLTVVAALLTLIGYSINDTIVTFDRIRENLYLIRKESIDRIMNKSINQTLTRTLLTSFTTFLTVLALYIFGNEVIKDFALTLVFGIIVGTYSSIYIASSLVLEYKLKTEKR